MSGKWQITLRGWVNFIYCNYITELLMYIDLPTTIKKIKTYKHTYMTPTFFYIHYMVRELHSTQKPGLSVLVANMLCYFSTQQ